MGFLCVRAAYAERDPMTSAAILRDMTFSLRVSGRRASVALQLRPQWQR